MSTHPPHRPLDLVYRLGLSAMLLLSGCSVIVDGELSGKGRSEDCTGLDDGTPCGEEGFLCIAESCVPGGCGDGFIDEAAGEQCEDGNEASGDGCEPGTCIFSCEADPDCDDGRACNGAETCLVDAHTCEPGPVPDDGTACSTDEVTDGVCRGGECVAAGCGNGVLDADEQCDDGNMENADGCDSDCTYSCESDAECDDASVCTGVESCDLATHTCMPGDILACDDGNDCTDDTCDPETGCANVLIDEDGDGHAPTSLGECGGDCDDMDDTTFPGAPELCEPPGVPAVDNDCDPMTPNPSASLWFLDCDEDGYSFVGAVSRESCEAPAPQSGCGWTQRIPSAGDPSTLDCNDTRDDMYPGNRTYYPEAPATSGGAHPTVTCPSGLTCTTDDTRYGDHDCDSNYGDNAATSAYPPSTDSDGAAEWTDYERNTSPFDADSSGSCSITVTRNFFTGAYQAGCSGSRGWTRSSAATCGYTGSYTYCGTEATGFVVIGSPIQRPLECLAGSAALCPGYTLTCVGSSTDCSRLPTCTPGSRDCRWHYYRCPRTTESRTMRCR